MNNSPEKQKYSIKQKVLVGLCLAANTLMGYVDYGVYEVNEIKIDNQEINFADHVLNIDVSSVKLTEPNPVEIKTIESIDGVEDITVGVADERLDKNIDNTYVVYLPYSEVMNERGVDLIATAAQALKAKVVGVEFPGVGVSDNAKASWPIVGDIVLGSFDLAAKVSLDAAKQAGNIGDDEKYKVIGYSLGAQMAATLFNDPNIADIYLIDPVNVNGTTIPELIYGVSSIESGYNYEGENNKYPWLARGKFRPEIEGTPLNQMANIYLTVLALSGYSVGDKMVGHSVFPKIHFIKFEQSVASDSKGMRLLRGINPNTDITLVKNARHQELNSMPFFYSLLNELAKNEK